MTNQARRVKVVPAVVADCSYAVVYVDHGEVTLLGRFPVQTAARGYQRYVRGLVSRRLPSTGRLFAQIRRAADVQRKQQADD